MSEIKKDWKIGKLMANGKENVTISSSYYLDGLDKEKDEELEIELVNDLLEKAFLSEKNGEYNYVYEHHFIKRRGDNLHIKIKLIPN